MAIIDIILIAVILYGAIRGMTKGLARSIGGIAGLLLAVAACRMFGQHAVALLESLAPDVANLPGTPYTGTAIAYILLFVAVWLAVIVVAHAVRGMLRSLSLGGFDRIGGLIFGVLKYAVVLSVVLNVVYVFDPDGHLMHSSRLMDGKLFDTVMQLAPKLWGLDIFPT